MTRIGGSTGVSTTGDHGLVSLADTVYGIRRRSSGANFYSADLATGLFTLLGTLSPDGSGVPPVSTSLFVSSGALYWAVDVPTPEVFLIDLARVGGPADLDVSLGTLPQLDFSDDTLTFASFNEETPATSAVGLGPHGDLHLSTPFSGNADGLDLEYRGVHSEIELLQIIGLT